MLKTGYHDPRSCGLQGHQAWTELSHVVYVPSIPGFIIQRSGPDQLSVQLTFQAYRL